MKDRIEDMGFLKGVGIIFGFGFLIGIGVFLGLREGLSEYTNWFFETILVNLESYEIEEGQLLLQVLSSRFRTFFLLVVLGVSILGIPSILFFLIYKGFMSGFLMGSLWVKFAGKGILIGLMSGFPQILIYAPVILGILHKNYYMGVQGLKKKLFLEQLPSIIILALLLLIGCFMEAYINSWIMKIIL